MTESDGPRHAVVIVLRRDDLVRARALPPMEGAFRDAQLTVSPPTEDQLRQMIEQPARLVGLKFEQGVVDRLVNDVAGEPWSLPLLQFALTHQALGCARGEPQIDRGLLRRSRISHAAVRLICTISRHPHDRNSSFSDWSADGDPQAVVEAWPSTEQSRMRMLRSSSACHTSPARRKRAAEEDEVGPAGEKTSRGRRVQESPTLARVRR